MRIGDELRGADLGDMRLSKRLVTVAEQLAAKPNASFPKAAGSDGALEGTYRFLNHEEVTPERILEPHIAATVKRAQSQGSVIVAHDTSEFRFAGDREGLGWIDRVGANGFLGHFALAVSADGTRRPLGVMGMKVLVRTGEPHANKHSERRPAKERESRRWGELAAEVGARLRGHARVIHVMDCEADSYALFAQLLEAQDGFVIRMRTDRRIETRQPGSFRIEERMSKAEELFVREVPLSARKPDSQRRRARHEPRSARLAKLGFSAVKLTVMRPDHERAPLAPTLTLNTVRVFEIDAPAEAEPVEWLLMTNEPIDTLDQVAAVVDAYRTRWMIEEFFKALKTGCAFEKRQLESLHALHNALAVLAPIAWRLLLLRLLGRVDSPLPAAEILTPLQLHLLRRKTKKLPAQPTIRQAMLAVAQLGGHIKNNGDPGWIVLGRGYEELLILEEGARIALEM
jgi:hypothetical protein